MAAIALGLLYVAYLAAGNAFLHSRYAHELVNRKPEKFQMDWNGGHTWWPGRVVLRQARSSQGPAWGSHWSAVHHAAPAAAARATAKAVHRARSRGLRMGQPRCGPSRPASSNMPTSGLPSTAWSLASGRMVRLSLGSCRPWALM